METKTISEALAHDLAKCTAKSGYRPIWDIAKINNHKERQVNFKKVDHLPVFTGS